MARQPIRKQMKRVSQRMLMRLAPAQAARQAQIRFVTPDRYPRPQREKAWLERGTPVSLLQGTISATSWGDGPIVLLVHGWSGRGTQMGAFIDPLVASGRRVIAVDGPAHGDSQGEQTNPLHFGQNLYKIGQELGPIDAIIAHSFGGAATALALDMGLVARCVVLLASPSSLEGVLDRYASYAELPAPVTRRFKALMYQETGEHADAFDVAHIGARLTTPLLVMHDPEDQEVPYSEAEAIVRIWSQSLLYTIHNRGHRRMLFAKEVVEAAVHFVVVGSVATEM